MGNIQLQKKKSNTYQYAFLDLNICVKKLSAFEDFRIRIPNPQVCDFFLFVFYIKHIKYYLIQFFYI